MVCGFGWEKTSGWRGPKKRVRMGTNLNFKISEVVVGSNKKCKRFCFQDMVGEWIRSEMAKGWLEGIKANLGLGVKEGDVGIHGVDHIGRLEWLWGIKQAPADMIGRVALMPFQIQEPEGRGEDKKLPYLMYFCWKRETHKLLRFESIFHPSFDIKDKFTSFISLNPRPPWSFGKHKEFQDLSVRLRVLSFGKPHQKLLKALSNCLQRPSGNKKNSWHRKVEQRPLF